MAELRVALLGYGLAGSVFHAPLVASTPGLRLAAVVTANPERAAQAAREHQGILVLDGAERVWQRAGELDVVVVATPNRTHAGLALAALDAGLPVVVDKPMAGRRRRGAGAGRPGAGPRAAADGVPEPPLGR
jgi:scyllo-inositol 2-dehydrogenase (NADP+)